MRANWVLVAGSSEADLYSQNKPGSEITVIKHFKHDESRVLRQQLASDKPGRTYDSYGAGRHGMDPENSVKDEESRRFAREIVASLEEGCRHREFESLTIIAEPKFLGCLRKTMPDSIIVRVRKEIPKNMVGHDASEIRGILPTRPWN